MPILHWERLRQHVLDMNTSIESYCFLASLCAFMMIQPGMKTAATEESDAEAPQDETASGEALVDEVLRVRKGYDYIETSSTATVMTSFFLFGCYFCLDKHKTAWFYLREATTLAHSLDMHLEETYSVGDAVENIKKRRLFWLLFLTERFVLKLLL